MEVISQGVVAVFFGIWIWIWVNGMGWCKNDLQRLEARGGVYVCMCVCVRALIRDVLSIGRWGVGFVV